MKKKTRTPTDFERLIVLTRKDVLRPSKVMRDKKRDSKKDPVGRKRKYKENDDKY